MHMMGEDSLGNPSTVTDSMDTATHQSQWSVEKVVASLPEGLRVSHPESPVTFFHMLERLKTTKREGWRRFGIDSGESISDHMYRMSIITLFAPTSLASRLDVPRCMKMALVHDMAEALVGDITPMDGVPKDEKSRRESTTMDYLVDNLLSRVDGGVTGREIKQVWQEYEEGKTLESQFVHDIDKIELVLQMVEYEKAKEGKIDLGEFAWVAGGIKLKEVKQWAAEVLQDREEFWTKNGEHTRQKPWDNDVEYRYTNENGEIKSRPAVLTGCGAVRLCNDGTPLSNFKAIC